METPETTNNQSTRRPPLSGFSKTLLILLITDVVLLLILTYGSVFPSRMKLPDSEQQRGDAYYDYTAKVSPLPKIAPKAQRRGHQYSALLMNQR